MAEYPDIGNPSSPSFLPSFLATALLDPSSFTQRLSNFIGEVSFRFVWEFVVVSRLEAIYRTKLNDQTIPDADEILWNASLIFSNSHFSLGLKRPFLPDIVEVGGMHCKPAKELPKQLADHLKDVGTEGFIYFSMGSLLQGSLMPDKLRLLFLRVFASLKQKVIWKWETESMKEVPQNVKLSKWLPQQDILGHPKCRIFITHGGFSGITEAVYHGVPLIGIPMFGDPALNMELSEAAGFAITLDFNKLTEDVLLDAITLMLEDPKYTNSVKKLSNVFRDTPDQPLDRAVFWTEYVLRHKGAVHLRSAARNFNFIQYHSIDVVLTLLGAVALLLLLVFLILKFTVQRVCNLISETKGHVGTQVKKQN